MPRTTRKPPKAPAVNSFVASAARITTKRTKGVPQQQSAVAWQAEAWKMLDEVGELEFYREWISNAMSRVTLYVTEESIVEGKTVRRRLDPLTAQGEAADAVTALEALYDGDAGQPQMLAAMAGHLAVPGETWLVGLLNPPTEADGPDLWRVLDRSEITQQGTKWVINRGDGTEEKYEDGSGDKDAEVLCIRIWRSHPKQWVQAHSSVRSALPILRELLGLTAHVAANIDSRLAGAGVLFVPSEMTFASPVQSDTNPGDAGDPSADAFMAALTDAMVTAMADRGAAESVAPIVARAPGQWIDKVKHITFWSELSGEARELRKEALQRLANSLDVPAEVLLGMADVNHWTGWLLDENAIKMHVEPLGEVITHGLTTRYLWPALQGDSPTFDSALRRFHIEADTSALRQRPNRSAEAQLLHGSMVITDAALARETGFEGDDLLMPDSEEYRRRLVERVAGGVTTPDLTAAALGVLGVDLTPKPSEVEGAPAPVGELPSAPSDAAAPAGGDRNPPEQQAQAVALLLGCEAVVMRAVERAWNKAGRRGGERRAIEATQLDDCLRDAWAYIPRVAALTGVDPERLHRAVDGYTRQLLVTGSQHDPVTFSQLLVTNVLTDPPEALSA